MAVRVVREDEKISWVSSVPFFVFHAALLLPLWTGVSWKYVALAVGSYYLRMFFVTAFYHRYFSHRTFKTSRAFQFFMAAAAQTTSQKGALWWAANHRHHHKFSDMEEDVHSPLQRGFWWSHVGWILSKRYDGTDYDKVKDLAKFPELVWLNKHWWVPEAVYGVLMALAFGWQGLLWGFVISTVFLWHGTFTINSLAHVWGSRRYKTTDTSRNNFILALITCGEGWHNNHHYYQSTANQGFFWWEVDASYYALKVLSWMHVVWDLRTPPKHILAGEARPEVAGAEISPAIEAPSDEPGVGAGLQGSVVA